MGKLPWVESTTKWMCIVTLRRICGSHMVQRHLGGRRPSTNDLMREISRL